jgi:hypothetical protein
MARLALGRPPVGDRKQSDQRDGCELVAVEDNQKLSHCFYHIHVLLLYSSMWIAALCKLLRISCIAPGIGQRVQPEVAQE